jgi:hypothetical protein
MGIIRKSTLAPANLLPFCFETNSVRLATIDLRDETSVLNPSKDSEAEGSADAFSLCRFGIRPDSATVMHLCSRLLFLHSKQLPSGSSGSSGSWVHCPLGDVLRQLTGPLFPVLQGLHFTIRRFGVFGSCLTTSKHSYLETT